MIVCVCLFVQARPLPAHHMHITKNAIARMDFMRICQ